MARGCARVLGGIVMALLGAALVFVVALYLRLAQGPIDLAPLVPVIEAAATAQMDGARLELRGVELALGDGEDPRPGLRLRGVSATDAQGARLFAAPRARVDVRPLDLLGGRLRVTAIAVAGADMRLRRDRDGRFSLGIGEADPEPGAEDDPAFAQSGALADAMAHGDGPLGSLSRVAFRNARLVYDDAMSGRVWTAENAALQVRREGGHLRGSGSLSLPGGAYGATELRVDGERADDGGATLSLRFSGAAPRDLALQFPALAAFGALEAPLSGEASAAIDGDGALLALSANLQSGAGSIIVDGERVALRDAAFAFSFNPVSERFDIQRIDIDAERGAIAAHGVADVVRDASGAPTSAVAQIDVTKLALDMPGVLEAPVAFDGGRVTARVTTAPLRVELGQAYLTRGPLKLTASGAATLTGAGWRGEISATGRDLTAEALRSLWPLQAAAGARAWIAENLEAGIVDRVDAFARLGPQTEDFSIGFSFRDVVAHYFRPLPPVEGAAGWGAVDTKSFAVTISAGTVTSPGGGVIDLAGSSLRLPDIDDPRAVSSVEILGNGPIASVLEVLDFPPLGFPGKLGLDPRSVSGSATARGAMVLPLLKDLLLDDIAVDVTSTLSDVAMTAPGLDLPLRAKSLALQADTAHLDLSGDAVLGKTPLNVAWRETFSPEPGNPGSVFNVKATLGAQDMATFGFDAGERLTGAVGVDARITLTQGGPARFDALLDLGQAGLSLPEIGWSKPAGAAAKAQVNGAYADAVRLEKVSFDAPGLSTRGALDLGADGDVGSVDLTSLRIGKTTDIAVKVARNSEAWAIRVSGATLDASPFLDAEALEGGGGSEASGSAVPAVIDLDVTRLTLRRNVFLSPAAGRLTRAGDGALDVTLSGQLGGQAAIDVNVTNDAKGTRATAQAPDAGAVLRAAGLFDDAIGGRLDMDAQIRPDAGLDIRGEVRIEDLVIARDRGFDALLAETDLEAARRRQRKEGMKLDTIRAPFRLNDGKLTINEAVAYGPSVGVTMSGDYDLDADRLDMRGVYSPAFGINSALGKIPLLGTLLTGGEGQGVVGVTFRLRGPADDPDVEINPFSALAPGILRRLLPGAGGISDPETLRALDEQFRKNEGR
jgi:hypothetical protein